MKRVTWAGETLSGDDALELHRMLVVEALPELQRAVDPARKDGVAFVIVPPDGIAMEIGFGPRDDVFHDLMVRADTWRSFGVRRAAAELLAEKDAEPDGFRVVVVAAGLVTCMELPISLLGGAVRA